MTTTFRQAAIRIFRDLDIVGAGPIVPETSGVFDRFWNGPWSVPVSRLVGRPYTAEDYESALAEIRDEMKEDNYPLALEADTQALLERLGEIFADLIWAPGQIVWEDPASIYEGVKPGRMRNALYERLETVNEEILIESAYFVPRQVGVEAATELAERGARMRILTNSLAANDVLAAHAGYSRHRKPFLEAGVELYELRPFPGPVDKNIVSGESHAALHTKAIVFDRKDVLIGSFNLDPRSSAINTEAGIYVESPELARQVMEYMEEGVAPENAFRVLLDDDGDLRWVVEKDGFKRDYDKDPNSRWYQRWIAGLIRVLPVEQQL